LARGWLGRIRVRKIKRIFMAARNIQRTFRGFLTRVRMIMTSIYKIYS
jgi:hypothetical protein